MKKERDWRWNVVVGVAFLWGSLLVAQQTTPDMILYNGKIVTVDDNSFTSRLGTVTQAMHVKDGKVLHVGNNSQIQAMAGPNTRVIDLKGRTRPAGTDHHPRSPF